MFKPNTLEEIQKVLENAGINGEYSNVGEELFNRVIKFKVGDIEYKLVWYHNQSYLHIGTLERSPFIPFKFVFIDKTYPIKGNCLAFANEKFKRESIMDREYPFGSFRIPL